MAGQIFTIRKGDTFKVLGTYKDLYDNAVDLTTAGITIEAWAKRGDFKQQLTVSAGTAAGQFTLSSPTDTWPLGIVTWFMRFTSANGDKTSSNLYQVMIDDSNE